MSAIAELGVTIAGATYVSLLGLGGYLGKKLSAKLDALTAGTAAQALVNERQKDWNEQKARAINTLLGNVDDIEEVLDLLRKRLAADDARYVAFEKRLAAHDQFIEQIRNNNPHLGILDSRGRPL